MVAFLKYVNVQAHRPPYDGYDEGGGSFGSGPVPAQATPLRLGNAVTNVL